jgi:hypothetical protein
MRELILDTKSPINYVTAKQIKEITRKEPQIMAKMDRIESMPVNF